MRTFTAVAERLLTAEQLAGILAVTTRTVWRYVAIQKLPPPVYLSPREPRWKESRINNFLETLTEKPFVPLAPVTAA